MTSQPPDPSLFDSRTSVATVPTPTSSTTDVVISCRLLSYIPAVLVRALGFTAAFAAALVPACEPACEPPEPQSTEEVVALAVYGLSSSWTRLIDADLVEDRYGLGSLREAVSEGVQVRLTGTAGTAQVSAADLDAAYSLPSSSFNVRGVTRDRSTNSDFAFIGNSLGVSITESETAELPAVLDGVFATVHYDAVGARCTADPGCRSTGIDAAQAITPGTEVAVIELGINDASGSFPTKIDQMMQILLDKGVDTVLWLTSSTRSSYASWAGANNNALTSAAAGRWSGRLVIVDWNAHSSGTGKDSWFQSDRIHLTGTGQAEMALLIRDHVIQHLQAS